MINMLDYTKSKINHNKKQFQSMLYLNQTKSNPYVLIPAHQRNRGGRGGGSQFAWQGESVKIPYANGFTGSVVGALRGVV